MPTATCLWSLESKTGDGPVPFFPIINLEGLGEKSKLVFHPPALHTRKTPKPYVFKMLTKAQKLEENCILSFPLFSSPSTLPWALSLKSLTAPLSFQSSHPSVHSSISSVSSSNSSCVSVSGIGPFVLPAGCLLPKGNSWETTSQDYSGSKVIQQWAQQKSHVSLPKGATDKKIMRKATAKWNS